MHALRVNEGAVSLRYENALARKGGGGQGVKTHAHTTSKECMGNEWQTAKQGACVHG